MKTRQGDSDQPATKGGHPRMFADVPMLAGSRLMAKNLEFEIREKLLLYTEGTISIDVFQEWFDPLSWSVEMTGDEAAIALAHKIDGIFAEASSADWDEGDLRGELSL